MTAEMERNDEGFTLIEMLIATMITAIILTVIVASFLVFFNNATYISGRDDHAAGASVLATWLDRDLASATSNVAPGVTPANCDTTTTLLTLKWTDYKADVLPDSVPIADTAWRADYQYAKDSAGHCMVQRVVTKGGVQQAAQAMVTDLVAADFSFKTTADASNKCPNADKPITATLVQYH